MGNGNHVQAALNNAFSGAGRIQAAVASLQIKYDECALHRMLTEEDLDTLRRLAYNARTLTEKVVEFMVAVEQSVERRMEGVVHE